MIEKQPFRAKNAFLLCALSLVFVFVALGIVSKSGVSDAGPSPVCVPKPAVTSPPPAPGASVAPAAIGPGLCPEGFVPQPVESFVPRNGSAVGASNVTQLSAVRKAPVSATAAADLYYAGAYQNAASAGATAFLTQHQPAVATTDFHSLAEMAVKSTDQRQIIEIGWTVDRALNGDSSPHLFVYHWVDGVPACYNGCGWVQYSSTLVPGMTLPGDGSGSQYMILNWLGDWWVGYNGQWMGFFPGSLWNGVFNEAGLVQWFGEAAVQAGVTPPLSAMGNGSLGSSADPVPAKIYFAALYNEDGSTRAADLSLMNWFGYLAWYDTNQPAGQCSNCFSYGGRGGTP